MHDWQYIDQKTSRILLRWASIPRRSTSRPRIPRALMGGIGAPIRSPPRLGGSAPKPLVETPPRGIGGDSLPCRREVQRLAHELLEPREDSPRLLLCWPKDW